MNIGDKIPEVLGFDASGREVKASDFAGKKLVIYFYPKDNTPGCTAEACSISAGYGALRKAGYEIVGVSKDSAASHEVCRKARIAIHPHCRHRLETQRGVWRLAREKDVWQSLYGHRPHHFRDR